MAKLLRTDGAIVEDAWQRVEGDVDPSTLPAGPLLVPLACWLQHHEALRGRGQPLGVWLAADEAAESLEGLLQGLEVIAVHFPVFSDGRGYSNARILRERLGWTGELRAVGDVLRDQLYLMRRCGFDSFAVRADRSTEDARASLDDFQHAYQRTTVNPGAALVERRSL